ncbi:MAG TPA: ABC transporter permease [Acidimicrobiia bacterium]|nr:ABC transporter permease [Acidimicrobiia bacterium]
MFYAQLILTGLARGALLSLAGMGLVLTYRATGVFNFAHGAIGVFVAYVLYAFSTQWGLPLVIAGPLALLVVGPGIGVLLERAVFRPLARQGATTTEKLVATLGVFVLLLGVVITVWSGSTRVPVKLVPAKHLSLPGSLDMGYDDLANLIVLGIACAGLWALFRFTHLGTEIRAVVDRPELAQLASVNANRVAAIAWALGTGFAGITGVLLLSRGALEPIILNLVMIEVFSLAVVARLTSLPIAVGAGLLILGAGQSLLGNVVIANGNGFIGNSFDALKPNLSVVVLFVALLVYKRLDVVGEAAERVQRLAAPIRTSRTVRSAIIGAITAAALVVLPLVLDNNDVERAQSFLAFSVIFVSIVAVTGFSGQITLGQAGYAGLGAWMAARMGNAWDLPVIVAMILGAIVAMAAGILTGYPALRRRGLFLALTTLAFALLIFRFVLQNKEFAGGSDALLIARPEWFTGPVAFYYFELGWLALMFLLARNLRSGRLGRALGAMRDSEDGARSIGIDLRAYKLFIFGASAFIAGIGGALFVQRAGVLEAEQFFPLSNLFWFAAVVVAGVSSIPGALLAAFIWVMLDIVSGVDGLSQLVIGAGALTLGRLPGGSLIGVIRTLSDRLEASARTTFRAARQQQIEAREKADLPELEPVDVYAPSEFASKVMTANGRSSTRTAGERQRGGTR